MNVLLVEKTMRLPSVSYRDLIGALVADNARRNRFLTLPASEQAFGLALFAKLGGDADMAKKLECEYHSLREPQYVCLEHMEETLRVAAKKQEWDWVPAALSSREPRLIGGSVGKWIR